MNWSNGFLTELAISLAGRRISRLPVARGCDRKVTGRERFDDQYPVVKYGTIQRGRRAVARPRAPRGSSVKYSPRPARSRSARAARVLGDVEWEARLREIDGE